MSDWQAREHTKIIRTFVEKIAEENPPIVRKILHNMCLLLVPGKERPYASQFLALQIEIPVSTFAMNMRTL